MWGPAASLGWSSSVGPGACESRAWLGELELWLSRIAAYLPAPSPWTTGSALLGVGLLAGLWIAVRRIPRVDEDASGEEQRCSGDGDTAELSREDPAEATREAPRGRLEQTRFEGEGRAGARSKLVYDSRSHTPRVAGESVDSSTWRELSDAARVEVEYARPYRAHFDREALRLVGVSTRGPGHLKTDTRCQDALRCVVTDAGVVVVAVADGLGSAPYSDLGARLAVDAAADYCANFDSSAIESNATLRALGHARERLFGFAREAGLPARDLACTLLVAVVAKDEVVCAQIGDGAMVILDDRERWHVLSEPEVSEYVNSVTPLTSADWEKRHRAGRWTGIESLFVFTDGIERYCLEKLGRTDFAASEAFFEPIRAGLVDAPDPTEAAVLLADTLGAELSRLSDDDKTLVAVLRRDAPCEGEVPT